MGKNYDEQLVGLVKETAKKAFTNLRQEHPEDYYYYTLLTTYECTSIYVSAASKESLARVLADYQRKENQEDPSKATEDSLRWSWADSPYCSYQCDDEYFQELSDLLMDRAESVDEEDDDCMDQECDERLASMEEAMRRLDAEGFFGTGDTRKHVLINAELEDYDETNASHAKRLNPSSDCLESYLELFGDEDLEELDEE